MEITVHKLKVIQFDKLVYRKNCHQQYAHCHHPRWPAPMHTSERRAKPRTKERLEVGSCVHSSFQLNNVNALVLTGTYM
jgi:hypothetical protein